MEVKGTFTYVDAGAVTLEAFGTHLRAYLGLFQALPKLEFIYLAPAPRLFQAAESEFYRTLYGVCDYSKSVSVLDYFRIRRAWEAKERVASADVVLLKEAQARYADRQFEELYEKWRSGAIADTEVTRHADQVEPSLNGVFRTILCGSSLSVFSDPRGNGAENCAENVIVDGLPQDSSTRSLQISGT
jgi:hypothetical protein